MTTWTASNKDRITRYQNLGRGVISQTYSIAAVNGNTGGTLTVNNMRSIDNFSLRGWRVTGPTALTSLLGRISGNTIVVTHGDPGENATITIKVWGKR